MLRYLSDRIAFTDKALKINLEPLEDAWEEFQSSRDRNGVYRYLSSVFELVSWWQYYDIAEMYARRACKRRCKSDPGRRMRSDPPDSFGVSSWEAPDADKGRGHGDPS